jgi:hypothetical protein
MLVVPLKFLNCDTRLDVLTEGLLTECDADRRDAPFVGVLGGGGGGIDSAGEVLEVGLEA